MAEKKFRRITKEYGGDGSGKISELVLSAAATDLTQVLPVEMRQTGETLLSLVEARVRPRGSNPTSEFASTDPGVAAVDQVVTGELGDAESESERLKRQAEKLRIYYSDIVETDQVLNLQKRLCKVTCCFFVQSMLLFLVFVLFLLQFSPYQAGFVPT